MSCKKFLLTRVDLVDFPSISTGKKVFEERRRYHMYFFSNKNISLFLNILKECSRFVGVSVNNIWRIEVIKDDQMSIIEPILNDLKIES